MSEAVRKRNVTRRDSALSESRDTDRCSIAVRERGAEHAGLQYSASINGHIGLPKNRIAHSDSRSSGSYVPERDGQERHIARDAITALIRRRVYAIDVLMNARRFCSVVGAYIFPLRKIRNPAARSYAKTKALRAGNAKHFPGIPLHERSRTSGFWRLEKSGDFRRCRGVTLPASNRRKLWSCNGFTH